MSDKRHDDDDGRSIADMSGVEAPSLFRFRKRENPQNADRSEDTERPWEKERNTLSRSERKAYIFSAVLTGIGIWAIFAVVFGLFIFLMTR